MRKVVFIIIALFSLASFSQEEENYKEASGLFMEHYNKSNYEAIFNMFGSEMKQALPKEKTETVLSETKTQYGVIKSLEFNRLENKAHVYKAVFENTTKDILMYLDPSNNQIGGLLITHHKPSDLPVLQRNTTKMILPFKEEWFVFWGGNTVEENYHVAYANQKGAYDLVIVKDGLSYKGDRSKNENFYVFGKEIIAPCDATVVKVITGVHDNIPGVMNPKQLTGNTVILETKNKEFILLAHFKKESIVVKEGQDVKQGDLLGQCGNSGNSSEPHLHLSLQNVLDMNIATGATLYFDKILVNGEIKEDCLPVKNQRIQNVKL